MSKAITDWDSFAGAVHMHILNYVIPQYGDTNDEPAQGYTFEDCIKQAQRYMARSGRQSRVGEEKLDLIKAAHWLQKAYMRLGAAVPQIVGRGTRDVSSEPVVVKDFTGTGTAASRKAVDEYQRVTSLIRDGEQARRDGLRNPYSGQSVEHALHAAGWVKEDLRLALIDASPAYARSQGVKVDVRIDDTPLPAALRDVVSETTGYGWEAGELQSFNEADIVRLVNGVTEHVDRDHVAADAQVIKLTVAATIKALGGDPHAFVAENGHTVLDVVVENVAHRVMKEVIS